MPNPTVRKLVTGPIEDFDVFEFRNFSTDDPSDPKWGAWSRAYEYEWVLQTLEKLGAKPRTKDSKASTVHNTSWGFEGWTLYLPQRIQRCIG